MRKFLSLLAAVAVIGVYSSSAFAVKALTEDELDLITAAGEPKVLMISRVSGSNVNISFLDSPTFSLEITGSTEVGNGSQTNLRALVLNNVVGENQVATGINIQTAGQGVFGSQENEIVQSWGSIKDFDAVTLVATVSAEADATGDGGGARKCVGINVCTGGDAEAQANVAAIGIALALSATADQIIEINDVTASGTGTINIAIIEVPEYELGLVGDAQNSLAALVINNVVGRNQVANGVNISGGSVVVGANNEFSSTEPFRIQNTGGTTAVTQSNNIRQFRGTPENFSRGFAIGVASNTTIVNDGALLPVE